MAWPGNARPLSFPAALKCKPGLPRRLVPRKTQAMSADLYLITPQIADANAFAPRLAAVLAAAPFAAVLLRMTASDEKDLIRAAKVLTPVVQAAGAAALLDSPADPRVVSRAGADGAHLNCADAGLAEAVSTLRPQRICGVGNLRTKHEAMDAGERDLDYVMFGEPRADGYVPEADKTAERAEWWASIFNMPCVAYAAGLEAVPLLAGTGAEFVALGPWVFDSADPEQSVREAHRLVALKSL